MQLTIITCFNNAGQYLIFMTINISSIILNLFDLTFQFYVSSNWTLDNMSWDPTVFDEFLSDMEKEEKV